MNILIAIDSFKGSLSSMEAGMAVKESAEEVIKDVCVKVVPLADGGEGTTEALCLSLCEDTVYTEVIGPMADLEPLKAEYGISYDKGLAVIESAMAIGLFHIKESERDIKNASSYGLGQMILSAINKGCRSFIIGLGGSATNDGGIGMLTALGYRFLDKNGMVVSATAIGLGEINDIDDSRVIKELKECKFEIACDVKNPLCGENGCAYIFAPQKGASKEDLPLLDNWMLNFAEVTKRYNENSDKDMPGAGAAGGLGFAFSSYLNAELKPGIELVINATNLEDKIKEADLVITGEGRLDHQTVMGKAPIGVARLAKKYGKKVIAFSGCIGKDAELCNEYGIDAFFATVPGAAALDELMDKENAKKNLKSVSKQVFNLVGCLN